MLTARLLVTLALSALIPASVGCTPPMPDEELGDSHSALAGLSNRITVATVTYDRAATQITASATIEARNQGVHICYAYQGTEAQKRACDDYPTNYVDMSCVEVQQTRNTRYFGGVVTECTATGRLGVAPFDEDGTYNVYFVNRDSPMVRRQTVVRLSSDENDGQDEPTSRDVAP